MSDKETAPWIRAAAKEIFDMIGSTSLAWYQTQAAEIIAKHAVECRAPKSGKYPIDRPCSACSDGDYEMKYHDHDPPFREHVLECRAPAPQPADLLQTIRYLLLSWSVFYAKLPDGAYDGLGELRTALANIKDVEVNLSAAPQVTPELELEQEADGRWLAEFTRFPGVMAYGPSKEEAIRNAAKVLIESEPASPTPREFKPYMEDHEYYDPPQASPTPDK